jgi:hypothetical protein
MQSENHRVELPPHIVKCSKGQTEYPIDLLPAAFHKSAKREEIVRYRKLSDDTP